MTKIVERNVAELLIIALFTVIFLSSCMSSNYNTCAAYANAEIKSDCNEKN